MEKKYYEGEKHTFDELLEIIHCLRDPKEGCSWDSVQTHETLKKCLKDECEEVFEAVDNKDDENLCEELGDVMLQVLLNAEIAKERGAFSMDDVIDGLTDKLIRRHPHVFGDVKRPENPDEALKLWQDVKKKEKEMKAVQLIANKIDIPGKECIMGNITLPTEVDGAKIEWNSSAKDIITDTAVGKMAAGVVTRQKEDVCVKLTANVSLGEQTVSKEIDICVKSAPKSLTEDSFSGYLFAHFIGEQEGNQEQIYFALSEKGLNFKDMNNCKPVLVSNIGEGGVRDPYLCRSYEGDRFFLIATDLSIYNRGGWFQNEQGYYDASTTGSSNLVLWESTDLVNWGEPKLLPVAPNNAGMAWAPEMVYHEETGEYVIFFASSIMNPDTKMKAKPNTIFYVTTRDFENFSETKILIDNQTDPDGKPREIIDTTIIKIGDTYYSASKDGDNAENNGGIRIFKTRDLFNPDSWEKVLDLDELGLDISGLGIKALDNGDLEGPELFLLNKCDWENQNIPEYGIMADRYAADLGYLPLKTTNLDDFNNENHSWKVLSESEYSFDKLKKRHGTIISVTREEITRIIENYS